MFSHSISRQIESIQIISWSFTPGQPLYRGTILLGQHAKTTKGMYIAFRWAWVTRFPTFAMIHCFLLHSINTLHNKRSIFPNKGIFTFLSVPLGKHALERGRYIIYRNPFHTCNTLSSEVRVHQTVYFHTCNTLATRTRYVHISVYCFPLHLGNAILEQAKCTLPSVPLGIQVRPRANVES